MAAVTPLDDLMVDERGSADPVAGRVDPHEALTALEYAADLLARADLDRLTDRGLLEHAVAVDRARTRVDAAVGRNLRRVVRRAAHEADGCVSLAAWWRQRTRRNYGRAAAEARTATRLFQLPLTRAALAAGEITFDHAAVIAAAAVPRRLEAVVAHEPTLVRLARTATPKEVAKACDRIADLFDPDPAKDPAAPDERRTLFLSETYDGLWDLRGLLDPVTGERMRNLVDRLSEPDPADTPADQQRSPAQRRHDGLDRVLRAAEEHPDLPTAQGARPHVALTIDLLALLGNDRLASRHPRLGSGTEITLDRATSLLEEAKLTPILMWGPYRPLGVGPTHRVLPAWLRRVLHVVHGHCRGPGCDRPPDWTQAAHLVADRDGGPVHVGNTLPLCPGHHRLLDHAGWTVEVDPDTAVCTWTHPDGLTTVTTHPPDP